MRQPSMAKYLIQVSINIIIIIIVLMATTSVMFNLQ